MTELRKLIETLDAACKAHSAHRTSNEALSRLIQASQQYTNYTIDNRHTLLANEEKADKLAECNEKLEEAIGMAKLALQDGDIEKAQKRLCHADETIERLFPTPKALKEWRE